MFQTDGCLLGQDLIVGGYGDQAVKPQVFNLIFPRILLMEKLLLNIDGFPQ